MSTTVCLGTTLSTRSKNHSKPKIENDVEGIEEVTTRRKGSGKLHINYKGTM